jgi:hypothetical protein
LKEKRWRLNRGLHQNLQHDEDVIEGEDHGGASPIDHRHHRGLETNMKESKTISQKDLQAAIRKFKENGGIIQKLPDQKSYTNQGVGVKWANVETPDVTSA